MSEIDCNSQRSLEEIVKEFNEMWRIDCISYLFVAIEGLVHSRNYAQKAGVWTDEMDRRYNAAHKELQGYFKAARKNIEKTSGTQ